MLISSSFLENFKQGALDYHNLNIFKFKFFDIRQHGEAQTNNKNISVEKFEYLFTIPTKIILYILSHERKTKNDLRNTMTLIVKLFMASKHFEFQRQKIFGLVMIFYREQKKKYIYIYINMSIYKLLLTTSQRVDHSKI